MISTGAKLTETGFVPLNHELQASQWYFMVSRNFVRCGPNIMAGFETHLALRLLETRALDSHPGHTG